MSADNAGLQTSGLGVRYGGVVANQDISIEVRPGELVGLIGPNGAGKTTFVDAVSGFTPYTGHVKLDGVSLDHLPPQKRRRAGLSRTWQSGELFGNLTVAQNILVAARPPGVRALWTDVFSRHRTGRDVVERVLGWTGLEGVTDALARDLTLGQQKLVGVARALAGECRLLLLDEPAAGLDSQESVQFGERVTQIAQRGPGVLLIDHDMSLMMTVCRRLYVMEFGRLIFAGTPQEARADERVVTAYLGTPMESEHV
jgi:ABC-type branched-subunit amino acid transport system ATPase component